MDLVTAIGAMLQIGLPVLGGAVVGVVVGGLIAAALRLDDRVLGLVGGVLGVAVVFFISGETVSSEMVGFATRIWGSPDMYR